MMEVAAQTEGAVRMGPGTLYGSVKRMLAAGLIEAAPERPNIDRDDERRRYYRLTDFGQRVLGAELQRLASVVQLPVARRLLGVEWSCG
jgi:DNA-binding PadR family transcriptional regulator